MAKKAIVIGAGFSGLSAAAYLAKYGCEVTVVEKNETPGGRAGTLQHDGFTFDTGPSWYWMPEVFEKFFGDFGKKPNDYYDLVRLDPGYQVIYDKDDILEVPANIDTLYKRFEQIEPGSSQKLKNFLADAEFKYRVGINKLVYKPGQSLGELLDPELVKGIFKLQVFRSLSQEVRKYFQDPRLVRMLEFPVLFLGSTAREIPALYSLMNYADLKLGTWYPMGGMYKVVDGMVQLAKSLGVEFVMKEPVNRILMEKGRARGVETAAGIRLADVLVASADYHHVEQKLLPPEYRKYGKQYWDNRSMAPSALLFFIGLKGKVDRLLHHSLFFDRNMEAHADAIYKNPRWPEQPLLYVSATSKTDPSVAPAGHENLVVLIPLAPGLKGDDASTRDKYFELTMDRLEHFSGQRIRDKVVFKSSFAQSDFTSRYNSFKGNAYGLANTLMQTAHLKPKMQSKVNNLYFTGQLTVPGPGVPPSLISGKVVAGLVKKKLKL